MKTFKWIVLIAAVFLPALSHSSPLGDLRVSFIEGDAQINTEDTGDWVPAAANMPLRDGDRIWVPEGARLEVQHRDGTALRLDEKTGLDVLTIDKDSSQFYLAEGRVYANFKGLRGSVLQIDTPISSVRAYDRAIFRIDILDDRYTDVSVYLGSVHAESRDGKTRVDNDMTLALREGFTGELGPMGPPDEWETWNRDRNRRYTDRRAPSPYLPEELSAYSGDFEDNGRWVYVKEYGRVWTPTVTVSAGWAPYHAGRWVWIAGDYVWVSYEPWGWVPYHYGRWAHVPSFGWCWVPPARGAVYWGPGFVGWVRTPTHVSWVPLAPKEIYYGHGNYGPHSVNITNINVTTINVNKVVYRNVRVQNAVTVIHHDTFVTGRHVDVKVRENPFLREKINVGRPDIRPERATAAPVFREIPQARKPPAQIKEIRVREIKERRPLTRERETSVLRPESPPREMTIKRIERRPVEREPEKGLDRRPADRDLEKGRDRGVAEKGGGKPLDQRTPERGIEKPRESKSPEKDPEKSRERRPPGGDVQRPPEIKSQDRGIEKPRTPETGIEKPRENRRSPELETRPPERGSGTSVPQQIEKPVERRSGQERAREIGPVERNVEKPKEMAPRGSEPVKAIEKIDAGPAGKERRPPEREQRPPVELNRGGSGPIQTTAPRPVEKAIPKPAEQRVPAKEVTPPQEIKPKGKEIEKGLELQKEQGSPEKTERTRGGGQETERENQRKR